MVMVECLPAFLLADQAVRVDQADHQADRADQVDQADLVEVAEVVMDPRVDRHHKETQEAVVTVEAATPDRRDKSKHSQKNENIKGLKV